MNIATGHIRKEREDRRRRHELLDSLCDPALVARAYRFIEYLYIHGNKKTAPGVTTSKSGRAE